MTNRIQSIGLLAVLVLGIVAFIKVRNIQLSQSPEPITDANRLKRLRIDVPRKKGSHNSIELEAAMTGGKFHKPLKSYLNVPGIEAPPLYSILDLDLIDSTPVIGIECDGNAIAIVEDEMSELKSQIINLNMRNKKSLSITFNQQTDQVRVLRSDGPTPIHLAIGGHDIENHLVLLHEGQRYEQSSTEIPLADHPFKRTSLGAWKEKHPDTKVCLLST